MEQENIRQEYERQKVGTNGQTMTGIGLNEYARMEQSNMENMNKR